jgi:hypothetical protein
MITRNHMTRSLFFTTMVNHRPVYTSGGPNHTRIETRVSRDLSVSSVSSVSKQSPSPTTPPAPTPTPPAPVLRNMITARSTQPVFSVSAIFNVRSGGGCGSCGH